MRLEDLTARAVTAPEGAIVASALTDAEAGDTPSRPDNVEFTKQGRVQEAIMHNAKAEKSRMMTSRFATLVYGGAALCSPTLQAMDRFVALEGAHEPPFTNWARAATRIQDAIDAAEPGDVVWVTNGVYATGGRAMAGGLTNRVALDKEITVRSVNGPDVTVIEGQRDFVTADAAFAIRCAWLSNGAVLSGFTLRGGQTRSTGDTATLCNGGGVWSASEASMVTNCVVRDNYASAGGGGAYRGTFFNSVLDANRASSGGGTASARLVNCAVIGNHANNSGGCLAGALTNCAITRNRANESGGGITSTAFNCIIWNNSAPLGPNYFSGGLNFCCSQPLPPGSGNTTADPRLLGDGIHISSNSPCRGIGFAAATGMDIDGQAWQNPPSMGCDEWQPEPAAMRPALTVESWGKVTLSTVAAGAAPLRFQWLKDDAPLTDSVHYVGTRDLVLHIIGVGPEASGNYQFVASNAFGMFTSRIARVNVLCVDGRSAYPLAPYATWASAAATIQDAVDRASAGDLIVVTNGIYASGGRAVVGSLTNRVVLDKPVAVMSMNGPGETIIKGRWGSTTPTGAGAMRCAWLADGAALVGFSLLGGATLSSGDTFGGGVWCASTNAVLMHCTVANCVANWYGGGVYSGRLRNCILRDNATDYYGGGAAWSVLENCAVRGNSANMAGGGVFGGVLRNCTVTSNRATSGGGIASGTSPSTNCIVWGNSAPTVAAANTVGSSLYYSCTTPPKAGTGNTSTDPKLLSDGIHVSSNSPCRGKGASVTTGEDIDGQAWKTPPAMGCDEWQPEPAAGLPSIQAETWGRLELTSCAAGNLPLGYRWLKDGAPLEDNGHYAGTGGLTLRIRGTGPDDEGSYQLVASNALGVATSQVARLNVLCVDAKSPGPQPPFADWGTAATTIQEAIEVATPADFIVVSNGLYANGGKAKYGDLTNRVALDKPLTVMSASGPEATIIQGEWNAAATNGSGAVRCAWLADGAALVGFTLQGGATRSSGLDGLVGGGGVWCNSTNALVSHCLIQRNAAALYGGGAYGGTLNTCSIWQNVARSSSSRLLTSGGGTFASTLYHCVVTENWASSAGGVWGSSNHVNNSIIWANTAPSPEENYGGSLTLNHCCTAPLPPIPVGSNNLASNPQLLDDTHIAATSPCRSGGSPLYASGIDWDGESWLSPPSIGCDEVLESELVGDLAVAIETAWTEVLANHAVALTGRLSGRASRLEWSFGDGPSVTNESYIVLHDWASPGDYTVSFTAFNADHPGGVSTNLVVHVLPLESPALTTVPLTASMEFWLSFTSQPGANYWIEYATNLSPPVTWLPLQAIIGTGDLVQANDAQITNAARFYRIRAQ